MRARRAAWAVLAAGLLAGCGSTVGTAAQGPRPSVSAAPPPAGTARVAQARSLCPDGVLRLPAERLPAGFRAVRAYQCVERLVTVAGGELRLAADELTATTGLGRLVAALRRPDQPLPPGELCPADLVAVPPLVLQGADGRLVRPRFPVDGCHQPQAAVLSVLASLSWTLLHQQLLRQVSPPVASCPPAYQDRLHPRAVPAGGPRRLDICAAVTAR